MTVSTSVARAEYNGNGSTVEWAVPWYFLTDADLLVIVTDADGVETTLTLSTGYTVTGAGDQDGGTITTTAAVATGSRITIIREPDLKQLTNYPDRGQFPAQSHERALDKLTMQIQRIYDKMTRFLQVGETSTGTTQIDIATLVNSANLAAAAVSTAQAAAAAAQEAALSLDVSNFPEIDGTKAVGTWNIDISGSAAKIGGVALSALVRSVCGVAPAAGGNVAVTKAMVGLGNVDNTADSAKSVNFATTASNAGNADTLDGNHANAFAAASHSHGYVPTDVYSQGIGMMAYADKITAGSVNVNGTVAGSAIHICGTSPGGTWRNIGPAPVYADSFGMFQRIA